MVASSMDKIFFYVNMVKLVYSRMVLILLFFVILCSGNIVCADNNDVIRNLKIVEQQVKKHLEKNTAVTVAIISESGDAGSGVIISRDGIILTAAHVVQNEDRVMVVFADGKTAMARVLGANFTRDAAMIKLVDGNDWPFVELGDSDAMKVGDFVVALGHAKGFDPTRRAPVRLGRLQNDGKQRFMISECTLIGGDSGGPLFDTEGRLVGIHSSIGPVLRINNHVPVNVFKKDWEYLIQGKRWGYLGAHPMSDPESAALGCRYADGIIGENGIVIAEGVIVGDVVVGSPADRAGLQAGDVIKQISGRVLENTKDMIRELGRYRPGEEADLVVVRNGETYKTKLKFERLGSYLNKMR